MTDCPYRARELDVETLVPRVYGKSIGGWHNRLHNSHRQRGSALLVILAFVTLMTVLVVSLLLTTRFERTASSLALGRAQAEVLADLTADVAMERITEAIAEGTKPNHSWASEPGRIHVFTIAQSTGEISRQAFDLFSGLPGADNAQTPDLNNVDLNKASLAGTHPVTGSRPGTMKVGWVNILPNPDQGASPDNRIAGRVAYWVDDESCKVNINTADGSQRGATPAQMAATGKYSYGFGTPSEISLAALPGLDQTKADGIASSAWEREFNSLEEITRAMSGPNQVVNQGELEALRFDVTHYNSSPDLNFMGEPRIALIDVDAATATVPRQTLLIGALEKTQTQNGVSGQPSYGGTLDQLYPQPAQLTAPGYLPAGKLFLHAITTTGQKINHLPAIPDDFYFGSLVANMLNGVNLNGQTFTWPKFPGASSGGFKSKYTPRQLDSIVLQLMDVIGKTTFCDQQRPYTLPGILESGWLSGDKVVGIGRAPRLTEVLVQASSTVGDPLGYGARSGNPGYSYPLVRVNIFPEFYYPKGFGGVPNNMPYDGGTGQWRYYMGNNSVAGSSYNYYDLPANDGTKPTGSGKTGTAWMDVLLTALDQNGDSAGIDFTGMSSLWADPDQAKAAAYHPYAIGTGGAYTGSIYQSPGNLPRTWGVLEALNSLGGGVASAPGCYISRGCRYSTTDHPARPTATSIRLVGGLQIWMRHESGPSGYRLPLFAPFKSIFPEMQSTTLDSTIVAELKDSVIPVDLTFPVPSGPVRQLARVADPMVNQFPADWEIVQNPANSDITMSLQSNGNPSVYMAGGTASLDPFFPLAASVTFLPANVDGDNPGFRPSGGGDPLSIWLPAQDIRTPKQARFPSVGALFSIRTGVFPDFTGQAQPYLQQQGVPFRALNMSPSTLTSQATSGGTSYPDWAMLDLFMVPFLPQKPFLNGSEPTPIRRLTSGGSTVGRININNPPVPYPFSLGGINTDPPRRHSLDALFYGLAPSKSYDASGKPEYSTIDAAAAAGLSQAIADYQQANGPFFMAGQIANVPALENYLYKFTSQTSGPVRTASISRNDLVRDTIGAITTRSNVYSIWVVAQTVKKKPSNANHGNYENGDTITSTVRRRYLVERYLEVGSDGVPGNLAASSFANPPNAYTSARPSGDLVTPTTPVYQPALAYPLPYRWRVIAMETIQM